MTPSAAIEKLDDAAATGTSARHSAATGARTAIYLGVLVAIAVISRLPQLLSPNLLLDGDECVVGLMAKHVADGKEFPVFIYGQHYGLAAVETAVAAVSFKLFGVAAVPLRLSVLAVWTVGVLFLFLALSRWLGAKRSFGITTLLILTPAWAVMAMKAWGGYATSFSATAAVIWMLAARWPRLTVVRWLVAGAFTALIYLAQPLWLPGLLPVAVAALIAERRIFPSIEYVAVATAAVLAVDLATASNDPAWSGPAFGNPNVIGSLPGVVRGIYVNLTGSYSLWWPRDPPGPATKIVAVVWCVLLAAAVLMQTYRFVARRYWLPSHLLFASVCSTILAQWLLLPVRDARYFLPLSGFLVLLVGIEFIDLVNRRIVAARLAGVLGAAALLLSAWSMQEFRRFTYLWTNAPTALSEAERMWRVVEHLQQDGVRAAFSMNGLLDYQLMFYSREKIVARWVDIVDRYPAYVRTVNRALARGEPIAVVGYAGSSGAPGCDVAAVCTGGIETLVTDPQSIVTIDGKYFVYAGASKQLLTSLGFQFPQP
jgi:hypothetical protein